MIHIGETIKQERIRQEETQEKLAGVIGVSRQTILNWEKGKILPDGTSLALAGPMVSLSQFTGVLGVRLHF